MNKTHDWRIWGQIASAQEGEHLARRRRPRLPGRVAVWPVVMWLAASGAAGCGAAANNHGRESHLQAGGGANEVLSYQPADPLEKQFRKGRVLVTVSLPGGVKFILVARPYRYPSKREYELGYYTEEPVKRIPGKLGRYLSKLSKDGMIPGGGGSGPEMARRNGGGVIRLGAAHGCVGPYEHALAYGMLYDGGDTVTASAGGGRTIAFKKVAIPRDLQVNGVLVYALLGVGSNRIVVRDKDGRVLSQEDMDGIGGLSCH